MRPGDAVEVRSVYRGRITLGFFRAAWSPTTASGSSSTSHPAPKACGWAATPMAATSSAGCRTSRHAHASGGSITSSLTRRGDAHSIWLFWTWRWKDEDDFAEAISLGVFTPDQAAAVRAEGERVIAARPWPTGWEDWRP